MILAYLSLPLRGSVLTYRYQRIFRSTCLVLSSKVSHFNLALNPCFFLRVREPSAMLSQELDSLVITREHDFVGLAWYFGDYAITHDDLDL